eukprot:76861_1
MIYHGLFPMVLFNVLSVFPLAVKVQYLWIRDYDQSDTTVAEASGTTLVTKLSLVDLVSVTQYFQNEDPNKKEFCMEMKDRYNAKIGESIKAYKYLCNVCVNPEGKSCSDIGCYIYLENKFKT